MKKIGIDARLYRQTGVGTYLQNFLLYLDRQKISGAVFYIYLMPEDFNSLSFKNKSFVKRKANYRWHTIGEQLGFLRLLYSDHLDLMHFTYFSYPLFYLRKFVATVHDVTLFLFKSGKASSKSKFIYQLKHFFFRIIFKTQIGRAIKIITPTRTVKKQLVDIYGDKIRKKIIPIYEGVSTAITAGRENKSLVRKYQNFFIYVGNFYPHKNVERLVEAFLRWKGKSRLILIGPDDYFTKRLESKIFSRKKILIVKNPPTNDLIFFYKNAKALIHPSLSEGFGLPLVEAAHFGCPIAASNIPVFRELLGDNYISFNPYDVDDIVRAIRKFTTMKSKPDYQKILKRFSFEKMTKEILKIYKSILL